ncbi:MAG: hypothetical protein JO320_26015 [Alphaproteobacteria bacterium]|nr:hypothetical protein [Alphaproteobacteria bacterium]MBV9378461.1 hypothetical protein [Alphaproteobacteria bacterium]
MELSKKVKTALDETRILILGAQVLLGFGFRGVFSETFAGLPAHVRYMDGVGLGLLVCTVALLIAPGPYHRIVEGGQDSGRLHAYTTAIADLALLPFALALGIGLFVGTEGIFADNALALRAGAAGAGLALALWYGLPQLRRRFVGERERMITRGQRSERADTPLPAKIEQLLTEARVILPGAQALFGFQLAIVLTQAFEQLPRTSMVVHAASLFLVALAVVMLMAPAPYHRIVYAGEDTEDVYRIGSALVTAATVPLGLGLAGDVYVVIAKISGSAAVGSAAGASVFVVVSALWYLYPLTVARTRGQRR